MSAQRSPDMDPRIRTAIIELQDLIRDKYPSAAFQVSRGEDPEGFYLKATVDVEDTDEVVDIVIDRLLEMEIDEELPVYFVPLRPVERVIDELASRGGSTPGRWDGATPSR
jgi:hypothetical protein